MFILSYFMVFFLYMLYIICTHLALSERELHEEIGARLRAPENTGCQEQRALIQPCN